LQMPSTSIIAVYLAQTTFAALVVGLILLQPRPYLAFVIVLFVGMLVTGFFTEAGTPDEALVIPFASTIMLELVSVVWVVVVFRAAEVRQRRQAQTELQRSRERYRLVSELVGDVIYSVKVGPGPSFTLDWMSGRGTFAEFTNLPLEGLFDPGAFIHPDDLERMKASMEAALVGGEADAEVRMIAPGGQVRWVRALAYGARDEVSGQVTDLYGVIEDIHDRKIAEEAVRKERSRFEGLVNSIDGVVYEIDTETRETLFISSQVERLLGYSAQDFLDNPMLWIQCVHPDDSGTTVDFSKHKIDQFESYEVEYRMIAADGQIVWVRDIASIISERGRPVTLRGLAINETASREAQQAEQEQRRLREALRATTAAISETLDLDEVADRILASLQATTPCDAADIMFIEGGTARVYRARDFAGNANMNQILSAALPLETTPNLREMVETGRPCLIDDIRADARWVAYFEAAWISSMISVPIRLDDQTIGFLDLTSSRPHAFTLEQTEYLRTFADQITIAVRNARLYDQVRRNAEDLAEQVQERTAELELERQRLSVMLDSTADGIYYTEGRIIRYANPAFCAMLGYRQDELIGQTMDMLAPASTPGHRASEQAIYDALARDKVWRGDSKLRRKDGTLLDGGLTVNSTRPNSPGTARLVVLVRDVSREKALQLQQSNLVAYASHELRTPITNLKTRLYLLRRRPELLDEHVEILEEVTERMRRLVEDLLDLTRMERGVTQLHRRVTDVLALAQSVYRLQLPEADRKSLHFGLSLPGAPIYADIDPERITQVITNLITNALNYTPAGGTVRMSIVPAQGRESVLIRVMDSGVGISADDLPFIFQPFYRVVSTVEGAGLGLSIAREIVELHGGSIEVKSQSRQGSTFTVRLPVVEAPAIVTGA
ncbi:MAG TPA: PAS domain-containing protein, partial [Candidatus Limnocylindrales bacterium]|nr:PAS domain-containing protein [Candidatus Limnocylindrales bacterium]